MAERVKYHTEAIPADTGRAVFLGQPMLDNMFAALTAVCGELWSVRRRLHVMESVMEQKGSVSRQEVESYTPTAQEQAAWNAQRDAFIKLVFDPFTRAGDIPYTTTANPNAVAPRKDDP